MQLRIRSRFEGCDFLPTLSYRLQLKNIVWLYYKEISNCTIFNHRFRLHNYERCCKRRDFFHLDVIRRLQLTSSTMMENINVDIKKKFLNTMQNYAQHVYSLSCKSESMVTQQLSFRDSIYFSCSCADLHHLLPHQITLLVGQSYISL